MMQNVIRRNGFSLMETIIAFILLGVIVTTIGAFASYVNRGVQDRQLALRLQWELENARELIGSWPFDEVTESRIEQIEISAELTEALEQPRWTATLQPQLLSGQPNTGQPNNDQAATVSVTSVHLQLQAGYRGQQIKPVELVFWIMPQKTVSEPADSQSDVKAEVKIEAEADVGSQSNAEVDSASTTRETP